MNGCINEVDQQGLYVDEGIIQRNKIAGVITHRNVLLYSILFMEA